MNRNPKPLVSSGSWFVAIPLLLLAGCASEERGHREVAQRPSAEAAPILGGSADSIARAGAAQAPAPPAGASLPAGDAERAGDFSYVSQRTECDRSATRVTDDYKSVARLAETLLLGSTPLSDAEETRLGEQLWEALSESMEGRLDRHETVSRFVRNVGERLAGQATRKGITYRFHVLSDDDPNAFALMGGRIVVHTGLLARMENEAQLAAVLAHEIGHIERKHGNDKLQIAKRIAGDVNDLTLLLATFLQIPTSSKHEEEADALALAILIRDGLSPFQVVRFFEEILPGKNTLTEQVALDLKTGNPEIDRLIRQAADNPLLKEFENLVISHPSGTQRSCRVKQGIHDRLKDRPDDRFRVGRETYRPVLAALAAPHN